MFVLLESKDDVAQAQNDMEESLAKYLPLQRHRSIGFPSDTVRDARVRTNGEFWHRTADFKESSEPSPRRLNWFGVYREPLDLEITVEVNIAYSGNNGRVAGFFAKNSETGTVYLMHSGRVGGGRPGVGKDAFLSWSGLPLQEAVDAQGNKRLGIVVMPVTGRSAAIPAMRYLKKIAEFKLAVREGLTDTPAFRARLDAFRAYYLEGRGRRRGTRSSEIDYLSRHGDVVDALHTWRVAKGLPEGASLVKSVLIDLGVAVGPRLSEVYEAKTSADRGSLYAAIGQVMVHGPQDNCRRVLVLPEEIPIPDDVSAALARLRIRVLRFTLNDEAAKIL